MLDKVSVPEEKAVKVILEQAYEDTEETDTESVWALDLGNHQYQLKNFPFYFYGLSYDDIFEARPSGNADMPGLYFSHVLKKSGHRTVRIFLRNSIKDSAEAEQLLSQLKALNCGYEGNGSIFFVVNIQPHCDFDAAINLIENSPEIEMWEMVDPVEINGD